VFRYLSPQATVDQLAAFLDQRLPGEAPDAARVARLYERNAPEAYDLPDRGYVARVHPLELWLVGYLSAHPDADWGTTVEASSDERQAVYRWLFRTRFKGAQDSRIYTMLEVEAFLDIHRRWANLAYPFGHLVPSLATAIGSSGDRPAALAELMGIILNDGMLQPTQRIEHLDFATGRRTKPASAAPRRPAAARWRPKSRRRCATRCPKWSRAAPRAACPAPSSWPTARR
jgi:membrane peptidoglycan carboxypeptidase